MSGWLHRLGVLIRRELRTPSFYLIAGLVFVLQFYLGAIALPSSAGRSIGVCADGETGAEIAEALASEESAWQWRFYQTEAALTDAVASGAVDSGFWLTDGIDGAAAAVADLPEGSGELAFPDLMGCVTYIYSGSTTKGEAAKETVYAAILRCISPVIVRNAVSSGLVLTDTGAEAQEAVAAELLRVTDSDALFDVRFQVMGETRESEANASGDVDSPEISQEMDAAVSGGSGGMPATSGAVSVAGILLFAAALLFATARFRADSEAVALSFRSGGFLFHVLEIYAPLLLTALPLGGLLIIRGETTLPRVLLLVLVLFLTALWAAALARLFRREALYLFLAVALIAVAAVLSADAGDLLLLRSVRWARFLMPASWVSGALL